MPRFFISGENISGEHIDIYGEDVSHIKRVLRLKCGDNIIACDGNGTDYNVEIEDLEQDFIRTRIIGSCPNGAEPPIDVALFQGIPKSDKMDFIIQKSVELGVKKIVPVLTERTVVKIENKKDAGNKRMRWQRIALEAAKQCNRGFIPEVAMPVSFPESLKLLVHEELCIIPYEKEMGKGLKSLLINNDSRKLAVFIGPEGGFAEKEIESAVRAGARPVTLGPRILRTETAGMAVMSMLMYELGDVGR